jgi:hypothetical protein
VAYRIINNVINIGAGETATYDVKVIDRSTGAPYILPVDRNNNVVVSFVVRPNVYARTADPVIKKYIVLTDEIKLDTKNIYDYDDDTWDNDYEFGVDQPDIKAVYRKRVSGGDGYEYRYYDANAEDDGTEDYMWKPYEFRLIFPFYHEDTIGLAPKQYKYEISLFAGPNLSIVGDEHKSLKDFNYKEILLSPTDFIVEGTLSE